MAKGPQEGGDKTRHPVLRLRAWLYGAALLLAVVAGCTSPPPAPRADTVVLGLTAEPATLNPLFLTDQVSYTVSAWTNPGLVRLTPELKAAPDLAEAWEIRDGGREIRFRLKAGVRWHDGREFRAEDVVFTYELLTSGTLPTPHLSHFGPVREVQALDPQTVVVRYEEVYSSGLESWTFGLLPRPRTPKEREELTHSRTPPGTGPYRVKEWLAGQRLVLEAFPEYHGGPPAIRTLILSIHPDPVTALMELRAGRLDFLEVTPTQYLTLSRGRQGLGPLRLYRCPAGRYGLLGFNCREARLQDPRVRRALSRAIDRQAIINAVWQGWAQPAAGPYPPGAWFSPEAPAAPEYDPEAARQELAALGWTAAGQPPLRLVTHIESRENALTAQIIQSQLQRLGIPVKIETYEWLSFRYRAIARKEFDLVLLHRHYLPDPDLYNVWHSSKTGEGKWNFLSYHNPRVDELLEKARRTLELSARRAMYWQIQEVMREDPPGVFLYHLDSLYLAHQDLKGLRPSLLGLLSDPHTWSWAREP
ncbi:MAG: ABC transporter substrate-binding protein [Desulfobaccales bacterium]